MVVCYDNELGRPETKELGRPETSDTQSIIPGRNYSHQIRSRTEAGARNAKEVRESLLGRGERGASSC